MPSKKKYIVIITYLFKSDKKFYDATDLNVTVTSIGSTVDDVVAINSFKSKV